MQGVDDTVGITLLKDQIEDTPVFKSTRVVPSPSEKPVATGPEKCHLCSKIVYPTERTVANEKVF